MKAPFYIYETANATRRAENLFDLTEQNSSRIRVSVQNFEQNKRFYEQNLSKPTFSVFP